MTKKTLYITLILISVFIVLAIGIQDKFAIAFAVYLFIDSICKYSSRKTRGEQIAHPL